MRPFSASWEKTEQFCSSYAALCLTRFIIRRKVSLIYVNYYLERSSAHSVFVQVDMVLNQTQQDFNCVAISIHWGKKTVVFWGQSAHCQWISFVARSHSGFIVCVDDMKPQVSSPHLAMLIKVIENSWICPFYQICNKLVCSRPIFPPSFVEIQKCLCNSTHIHTHPLTNQPTSQPACLPT